MMMNKSILYLASLSIYSKTSEPDSASLAGDVMPVHNDGPTNLLSAINFDTKQFTYLFILAFGAQGIGAYGIALAQRWLKFSAKTGCLFGAFWLVFLCLWGLVGLWTDKIGYHHGQCSDISPQSHRI